MKKKKPITFYELQAHFNIRLSNVSMVHFLPPSFDSLFVIISTLHFAT